MKNQVTEHFRYGAHPCTDFNSTEHLKTVNKHLDAYFYNKRLLSQGPTGKHRYRLLNDFFRELV